MSCFFITEKKNNYLNEQGTHPVIQNGKECLQCGYSEYGNKIPVSQALLSCKGITECQPSI